MQNIVSAETAAAVVRNLKHGQFFTIDFVRATPKCLSCGKTSKKWLVLHPAVCTCGGEVSYSRHATAQTGVHNTKDITIRPMGVGETFVERRSKGIVGFYDIEIGKYRECRVENITKVVADGNEYIVR